MVGKNVFYLGVDIAGDGGVTGVAAIECIDNGGRYYIPDPEHRNWVGQEGLAEIADLAKGSELTAVDQPFAWPEASMKLLSDEEGARAPVATALYLWRKTDKAMRNRLAALELPEQYVLTPTRCQNIWRALALAAQVGITREEVCLASNKMIETHPRLAWALCLQDSTANIQNLIGNYKEVPESREQMLAFFDCHTGLAPRDVDSRERCLEDDNELDALMCAYVAYLFAKGQATPLPEGLGEEARAWEGAAILPSCSWGK